MFSIKLKSIALALLISIILTSFALPAAADQSMEMPDEGIDLKAVDVCSLLPQAEVAEIIGTIRESRPTITIDREKGCQWVNKDGHFFEIIYLPLDQ